MKTNKAASVWDFSILQLSKNKFWYRGVILKSSGVAKNKRGFALRNAFNVLQTYFIPVYVHQEICLESELGTLYTTTDGYGRFKIMSDINLGTAIKITLVNAKTALKIHKEYPISFLEETRGVDIISDIDDTILVSNTANVYKRIKTLLFLVPEKRAVINFTKQMFKAWEDVKPRQFYVSKSESNLYGLLTTFIKYNNLPLGMLILTPYLNIGQLFGGEKPLDFKLIAIRFLITHSRSKHYILVGDDTQKDMSIYAKIAKEFPDLILKIYIRQTVKHISNEQKMMWEDLKATGVSASYFLPEDESALLEEIEILKQKIK